MRDFTEEAKKLIRINSISSEGNEEIANFLSDRMRDAGLKTNLQHVTHSLDHVSKRQFNVIGILGDPLVDKKTKKGLLLNTHIDTVGPGITSNWTETDGDPFNAVIKNGKIYGLGSADVKLDFLCKLRAIEKFREKKLKMPIYLVGTCGEEIGMFGAKYLIKSGALNPKYVVVGEPSDLNIVYAHKSLNIFKISIGFQMVAKDARGFNRRIQIQSFGKSAHGSYPHLGTNSIYQMIDLLRDSLDQGYEMKLTKFEGGDTVNKVPDRSLVEFYLTSHQFEDYKRFFKDFITQTSMEKSFKMDFGGSADVGIRFIPDHVFECVTQITDHFRKLSHQFSKVTDASFNPAFSTVNFGMLKQGLGGLDLFFDLRILPDQDATGIEKEIIKDVQSIASGYPALNISAVRQRTNPGLNMTLDHDLLRICKDALLTAGLPVKLDKKATSTEAAQYFQAGYEAVFGPGMSHGNSHSPNEHNILEHLDKATAFYEKLIERICFMILLREIQDKDIDALDHFAHIPGMFNLPSDKDLIKERITRSRMSFLGKIKAKADTKYVFVAEDTKTGKIVATSMIAGQHGTPESPHFYFEVSNEKKFSEAINTGFIHGTLTLGIETDGPSEVGALVVDPDVRNSEARIGRQISFVRFFYAGLHRSRFKSKVIAELLPLNKRGLSPLWEAIGRRFTNMDYWEADQLCSKNKDFIFDLFPSGKIYTTFLSAEARNAIGKVGKDTEPVLHILKKIGFTYKNQIDPFDGGPHLWADFDQLTPIKKISTYQWKGASAASDVAFSPKEPGLLTLSQPSTSEFRAVSIDALISDKELSLEDPSLAKEIESTLHLKHGDSVSFMPYY